ncbi:MAG: HAD family hydrolase [Nannocystaceae bacterium]
MNGGRVAAFFDIDRTLLDVNSAELWVRHQWRQGKMSASWLARSILWLVQYRFALLDFEAVTERAASSYVGVSFASVADEVRAWFDAEVAAAICVEGPAKIAEHRAAGHEIVILTSGTRFVADLVAGLVGVDDVLCTELEVDGGGNLTGRHLPPACGGAGKVTRAEAFAAERGVDLDASYFYSDSFSDLPMLARVGHPRVINPDGRLRRYARRRGWAIETWRAPGGGSPARAPGA